MFTNTHVLLLFIILSHYTLAHTQSKQKAFRSTKPSTRLHKNDSFHMSLYPPCQTLFVLYLHCVINYQITKQANIHPFTFLNEVCNGVIIQVCFFFKKRTYMKENFSPVLACSCMLLARTKTSASCGIRLFGDFVNSEAAKSLGWDYRWESFLFYWHFTWFKRRV